jgi:hypothetical protein
MVHTDRLIRSHAHSSLHIFQPQKELVVFRAIDNLQHMVQRACCVCVCVCVCARARVCVCTRARMWVTGTFVSRFVAYLVELDYVRIIQQLHNLDFMLDTLKQIAGAHAFFPQHIFVHNLEREVLSRLGVSH